jgi:hypothetical protein
MAALVDDQHAVGVAIERNADISPYFADLFNQPLGRGGADFVVDVEAVRLDANGENFSAELPQRFGRRAITRAIGAIDHDAEAFQRQVAGQGALGEFDVARTHVINAPSPAQHARRGELGPEIGIEQLLDFGLDFVGQFETVGPEELDAIVGTGPSSSTSMPTDVKPPTMAYSIM